MRAASHRASGPGKKGWEAESMGRSRHSMGSNNFRKVLLSSWPLVPQGGRPSQSFKYSMQHAAQNSPHCLGRQLGDPGGS